VRIRPSARQRQRTELFERKLAVSGAPNRASADHTLVVMAAAKSETARTA
jgi:hypothetical protein